MRQHTAKRKKLNYPEARAGSRLAAEIRKRTHKLTAVQRRAHVNAAMAMIYGSQRPAKAAGAGH